MRFIDFEAQDAHDVSDYESHGATWRPIARSWAAASRYSVGLMELATGAVLGRHAAGHSQLFLVLRGTGWVSGEDGERHLVSAGQAVVWDAGEAHESGSDDGMTAVIVQAERLSDSDEGAGW